MTTKHDYSMPPLVEVIRDYLLNIGLDPTMSGRDGDPRRSLSVTYLGRLYDVTLTDLDQMTEDLNRERTDQPDPRVKGARMTVPFDPSEL